MKKLLLLPVLLALLAPFPVRAEAPADEAAIKKLYEDFCTAWNKHDPKAMAAGWAADGDVINPFGRHARGTAEIEKLFTEEHAGPMATTTYTGTTDRIRHLDKNSALVESDGVITGLKAPDGTAAPPFKHHLTWVAEKRDGKWIAIATRAFVYVPPPPAQERNAALRQMQKKNLANPDEKRTFDNGVVELAALGGVTFGRATLQPGWKWSTCVKPLVNTKSCEAPHLQYHVSGRLHVVMDDGSHDEFGPGDVSLLPPGHDAWVVGNEPVVILDVSGMVDYAKKK